MLTPSNYLNREMQNEWEAVMVIINEIMKKYKLRQKDVKEELSTRSYGKWSSPGDRPWIPPH
jgi:hypothetical protein